ncbi:Gmad2 immunoglobulin-like domain-containing protein [Knoellia sp. S7-12]|uniref:Gmad2 immunoglobulin-like domain-containing protein n=1 Tax=Knoellia sp. S7-12 TaxID=3126698 RepID=UPI0033681FDD
MTTQLDPSDTERELREALAAHAREIRPRDRLDAILREASEPLPTSARRRWLTGMGVAAAAAAIAGAVWTARPAPDAGPTRPAGTPSATTPVEPSLEPSPTPPAPSLSSSSSTLPSSTSRPTSSPSTPSTPPSPTGQPAAPTTIVAQAIYRVGTNGGTTDRPGLVREFRSAAVGASESARATAAVGESLRRSDLWRGVTVTSADVARERITLRLSGPGDSASDADSARLAVAALVWTAQGAVGRGDLPVTLSTPGGGQILGQLDPATPFTRASTPPETLCDLWVDTPSPGVTVRAAEPVLVRGQAVAFEANVEWELRSGSTTLRDGFVTASIGAPSRGTFAVDLGRLEPGTYTFRAFTSSAEDGAKVIAERLVTFTVS